MGNQGARTGMEARRKENPLDKMFPIGDSTQTAEKYLDNYRSAPTGDVSDLKNYPPLVPLFRKYNTPLAPSASVERLFSKTGLRMGKLRRNISDNNLEKTALLQTNKK